MVKPSRVIPILVTFALAGCATQQSVTDQTAPMQDRLGQLDSAIRSMDQSSRSRDEALGRELAELRNELRALSARVDGLSQQSGSFDARLGQAERQLDGLSSQAGQFDSRLGQAERQLQGLSAQSGQFDSRLGQTERRLDSLSGQTGQLDARLGQAEKRLDGLSTSVKEAMALATQENIRINGREAFAVVLTEDKTLYPINSPELGGQDIAKLDDLVRRLAGMTQEYHLEIQGHTDNIGTEDYNYELGKARADVVKRFLHEQRGISLSRMSVISFGAGSPLDRNSTRNRRINIRVLVLK